MTPVDGTETKDAGEPDERVGILTAIRVCNSESAAEITEAGIGKKPLR